METRVRFLGHSLHQMIVFLPLGFLAGAVGSDVAYLVTHDRSWALMAYRLIAAGIAAGLVVAVPGFLDWRGLPPGSRAQRVGRVHGGGNVLMLLLFAGSFLMRREMTAHIPGALALTLGFAGSAVAGVTGWLGGELVSRLSVGVSSIANLNAPSSLNDERRGPMAMDEGGPRVLRDDSVARK
jgi:uncharacterized membrane protein